MKHFKNCKTLDQAKNEFRNLCKALHPDTSGYDSQSDFIRMYTDFQSFRPTETKQGDENFNTDKFYDLVRKFEHLRDISISFVGSFVWLEDDAPSAMYEQKEAIKAITIDGYNFARWAGKKKNWYFSPQDYKQKSKSRKTLGEIKATYGSSTFKMQGSKQLGA
jgi:hypothetical protein